MGAFITSSACISPQNTINTSVFPSELVQYSTNQLHCIEPNYRDYINPLQLRRMSKVLKMGLGAAMMCQKQNNSLNPDAILVGTALGCSDDLEKFLFSVTNNKEQSLSPTTFIQSTHNMVAAQIAVVLKNHNYNMTYCHRGFSFEEALIDAMMLIKEGQANTILLGGVDEMTPNNYKFFNYLDYWKKEPISNLQLLNFNNAGTIAGEGACFFNISAKNDANNSYINDVSIFYKPQNINEIEEHISLFLKNNNINKDSLNLVLLGLNGDFNLDANYHQLMQHYFSKNTSFAYYKHLCGEYATSSSFALWLANCILQNKHVPEVIKINKTENNKIDNILIYNHYLNNNHSLMLISKK